MHLAFISHAFNTIPIWKQILPEDIDREIDNDINDDEYDEYEEVNERNEEITGAQKREYLANILENL